LQALGAWWKRRIGDLELIYDGRSQFCPRSMAWLLAFDGLNQIRVRDRWTSAIAVNDAATAQDALTLVPAQGSTMSGFGAYRYLVLRVPGLWWLVPLFTVPVLSHVVGGAVCRWMANRALHRR